MSDHGSRRHARAPGVEPIGEMREDDEGSKNTGPAGTIGEPFDSKSENIESKAAHRIKKGTNQSTKGISNNMKQGAAQFEREASEMAVSNFAVVSNKIPLVGTAEELQGFSYTYNEVFAEFKAKLVESYKQYKLNYIKRYQTNFEENVMSTGDNIQNFADTIANDKE